MIFVDDNSPDGTASIVRSIGEKDRRVRCIQRVGRRGLSGAFIEGALSSQSPFVAVIDGDLQHDETRLTAMLDVLRSGNTDLVIASRYLEGGALTDFSPWRTRISLWATKVAQRFLGVALTDPMSGFFMVRRTVVEEVAPSLTTEGFKILLDIVATVRGKLRIIEIPSIFRSREFGESKLDARVALDFAALTVGKLSRGMISARFVLFGLVGLTGLVVHMVMLNLGLIAGLRFEIAQFLSTILIIALNYTLNNLFTYRDQRLEGVYFFTGLIRFEMVCSIGLISNIGAASWLYSGGNDWWLAGLGGALMGAIWNYAVSAAFVWKKR